MKQWEMGVAVLALCALVSTSQAEIIVDNTGGASSSTVGDASSLAQVFTMSSSSGGLSSITLGLSGSGSVNVSIYSTSGNAPSASLYSLGSISVTSPTLTIANPSLYSLTAGTAYAVVISSSSTVSWKYTSSTGSGTGTFGDFYSGGGPWTVVGGSSPGNALSGNYLQMDVVAVPEVPVTGAVMGFGVFGVAFGCSLLRKRRTAVSDIA